MDSIVILPRYKLFKISALMPGVKIRICSAKSPTLHNNLQFMYQVLWKKINDLPDPFKGNHPSISRTHQNLSEILNAMFCEARKDLLKSMQYQNWAYQGASGMSPALIR